MAVVFQIALGSFPLTGEALVGSRFRKRSPLFTSVLFNHYSTKAADGYLSA
jgi:hypothetical protein